MAGCGYNYDGQLGVGNRISRNRFVPVPTAFAVAEVSCCGRSTFLLCEDGSVAACGNNNHRQLGLRWHADRLEFVPVPVPAPIAQVAGGESTVFFRSENGSVVAAGSNEGGVPRATWCVRSTSGS